MRYFLLRLFQLVAIVFLVFAMVRYWAIRPVTCLPDCAGESLTKRDLSGYDLAGARLVETNLSGSDLSNANLRGADLSGAVLANADLNNADLSGTNLTGADLTGVDLRNAVLKNTIFLGANLRQTNLTRADLTSIALQGAILEEATLIEARLSGVDLSGANLRSTNLTGATLDKAQLDGASLSGSDLSGASLVGARLNGTFLNAANLTGANLSETNLAGAVMIGSNLLSANLRESRLIGAIAVGADFSGADLVGADLTGAQLFQYELNPRYVALDPVLSGMNEIQRSKVVRDANLNGVEYTVRTRWPDGKLALLRRVLGGKLDTIRSIELTTTLTTSIQPTPTPQADTAPAVSQTATIAPEDVQGDLTVAGGATIGALTNLITTQFKDQGYSGVVTVETMLANKAFTRFCPGEVAKEVTAVVAIDVVGTNRPINDAERAVCATVNRTPIRFPIGTDAVAVVINPSNSFASNLTLDQLKAIFTAERWNDVSPQWPAHPIVRYLPPADADSATLLAQTIFKDATTTDGEANTQIMYSANNVNVFDFTEGIVNGVTSDPYGVGLVNFKTYSQNASVLQLVSINGVILSPKTVEDGSYALTRPFLAYTDASVLQQRPQVATYLSFYLRNVSGVLEALNYFPNSPAVLNDSLQRLQEAAIVVTSTATSTVPTPRLEEPTIPFTLPTPLVPITDGLQLADVGGEVVLIANAGSISPALTIADGFTKLGFIGTITTTSVEDQQAFSLLCESGQADIVSSNRLIDADKTALCAEINRTPIAFRVGTEAIAVLIHPDNKFARALTSDQLATLFTAKLWSDVNPAWPAEPIQRFVPPTTSSVFNLFVQKVLKGEADRLLQAPNLVLPATRAGQTRAIATNPYAVGFVEFPFYRRNADTIGIVAIDGVDPSISSIQNGTYPLTRSLQLYSDAGVMRQKPQVAALINFYLQNADLITDRFLFIPARLQDLESARARLREALNPTAPGLLTSEVRP